MKKLYLITLPERTWHWTNAALFIVLAVTGALMHFSGSLPQVSLPLMIRVHNLTALLFIVNFAFWVAYNLGSGRIVQYLRLERDLPTRLITQARFYLFGIFTGAPHPFPLTEDNKFNPLQRVTYLGLMFFLLPAQVLTGLVLYGFTLRVEWIAALQAFRLIALAHTGLSYLLVTFLIGHLYLATTGDGPLDLVKTMITGCHEDAQVHGGE